MTPKNMYPSWFTGCFLQPSVESQCCQLHSQPLFLRWIRLLSTFLDLPVWNRDSLKNVLRDLPFFCPIFQTCESCLAALIVSLIVPNEELMLARTPLNPSGCLCHLPQFSFASTSTGAP